MAPPAAAAALTALELLQTRPQMVDRLAANASALREGLTAEGFDVSGSRTQIMPLVIGEAEDAMRICESALASGVFAQAIRPPTVPPMTSRLRLAVMATHRAQELRAAAHTLAGAARSSGFDPRTRMANAHPHPGHPEPTYEPAPAGFEPAAERSLPVGVFDFEASEPIRRHGQALSPDRANRRRNGNRLRGPDVTARPA